MGHRDIERHGEREREREKEREKRRDNRSYVLVILLEDAFTWSLVVSEARAMHWMHWMLHELRPRARTQDRNPASGNVVTIRTKECHVDRSLISKLPWTQSLE